MATRITTKATEESTYIITVSFTDEDGNAVTPNSIVWTLTDLDGTVINSREDVSIGSPASSVDIVLSGDDLQVQSSESGRKYVSRLFTVEAVYDSNAGSDLSLKDDAVFDIDCLAVVP